METAKESLNEMVIRLRESKGWTQEKLAEKSKVPRRTIQNMEAGEGSPRFDNLSAVLKALGVSDEALSFRAKEKSNAESIVQIVALISSGVFNEDEINSLFDMATGFASARSGSSSKRR